MRANTMRCERRQPVEVSGNRFRYLGKHSALAVAEIWFVCLRPHAHCMRTFSFDPLRKEESRLAITREKKEQLVAQYKEAIENASALVFTDFRGVSVSQINLCERSFRIPTPSIW